MPQLAEPPGKNPPLPPVKPPSKRGYGGDDSGNWDKNNKYVRKFLFFFFFLYMSLVSGSIVSFYLSGRAEHNSKFGLFFMSTILILSIYGAIINARNIIKDIE